MITVAPHSKSKKLEEWRARIIAKKTLSIEFLFIKALRVHSLENDFVTFAIGQSIIFSELHFGPNCFITIQVIWNVSGGKPPHYNRRRGSTHSEFQTFNLRADSQDTSCWWEQKQQFNHNTAGVWCAIFLFTRFSLWLLIDQIQVIWCECMMPLCNLNTTF